ncbi:probable secreted protein [Halalkalibacter wakoensis JCM 9140]|uniref:Probable secreted protein n=1 Tax=Halalkalibacter wakoensis JCM 9140 TaxID=1236970 RepID=W4PZQ1_9BACI|nr:endonuclease/exonuclease/phosphatase family protein [Halalkalibacter wakoensis]GAE25222.1 probable secreted protein [Halalkalibacter wakoensis JCM 9140]
MRRISFYLFITGIIVFSLHLYHETNKEIKLIHNKSEYLINNGLITVTSYNIQYGRGQDQKIDLQRTIETLQSVEANIISLQEVERNSYRSNFTDQIRVLAEELNMNAFFTPSLAYPGLYYGNAVLTYFPIVETKTVTFKNKIENRTALVIELQVTEDQTIHVINTHLGLNRDERANAIEQIYEKIKTIDGPILLTGDLNSVPSDQEYQIWNDHLTKSNEGIPFQTYYSEDWQIDYIFHSSDFLVNDVEVIESEASDHYPVTARMVLSR